MYGNDLDDETLERAAEECLTRPSDASFWDERLYTTHGAVLSWAERGDDILAESNYLCVLEELRGVAVHDDSWVGGGDGQDDPDDYVIDGTCSHWLVGSLRVIYVRVRGDDGEFTQVFRAATEIALSLKHDYPVFDESDFSEREWEAYEKAVGEAVDSAASDHVDDSDEDVAAIKSRLWTTDGALPDYDGPDVDWDAVAEAYDEIRDEHFAERAHEAWTAQIDGQTALPVGA